MGSGCVPFATGEIVTWHDPGGRVEHVFARVKREDAVFACGERRPLADVVTPAVLGGYRRPLHARCGAPGKP